MDYEDFMPKITKKEQRYVKRIQKHIQYCSYDQSYDGGEVVWIFGDKIELTDLLFDCNVPEESWDNVITHLHCPGCGHSNFELGEIIGLQTQYEREIEDQYKKAKKLYGKQIKEFEKHLEYSPMLGFQHKFGRKLYREIKANNLPHTQVVGEYFRARKVQSSEVYTSTKMYNAPNGKTMEGRFNHAGQSYLYLASEKEVALREVASDKDSMLVWCQQFELIKKVKNILDLSFEWSEMSALTSSLLLSLKMYEAIDKSDGNIDYWRPDYFLTRYIMDCAKSEGYNGIKYNSTKAYTGHNIVLFYPEKLSIKTVGKPSIENFINESFDREDFMDLPDF